jgi:hypothetical protein
VGARTAEKVREIEEIRGRLDAEIGALAATLPPKDEVVRRLTGAAVGGAVTVLTLWYLGHRMRVRRQDRRIRRLAREAIVEARPDGP